MDFYDILLAKKLSGGGGGGSAVLIDKNISSNGTYNASSDSADGYKKVVVSVPNTYVAGDEGKVVSSGALVSQTSATYNTNNTYDTTLINSVTVSVGSTDQADVNDVTFVDYDGTILYSYTKDQFLALNSMPSNPSHSGLTAQGWNWTLQQAKDYVTANEYLCIGQNYNTSDGKTHIHIDFQQKYVGLEFCVGLYTSVKNGVTIDWGDGNTQVTDANAGTFKAYKHQYASAGQYEITLNNTSGNYEFSYNGSNQGMFFANDNQTRQTASTVKKIYIGSGCIKIHRNMLMQTFNVSEISFPISIMGFGDSGAGGVFSQGVSLKCVVFPPSCTIYNGNHFAQGSNNLRFISFAYGQSFSVSSGSFLGNDIRGLKMFTLPPVSSFPFQLVNSSCDLERFCVGGTYTSIENTYCSNCGVQNKVVIPSTVTSISASVCNYTIIRNLYLLPTTPPTLSNANAFVNYSGSKFYVPYSADHSILNTYKTASNWSTFTDRFEEMPQ